MIAACRRFLRSAGILAIALCVAGTPPAPAEEVLTYRLAGLAKPAEIVVDRWGVPHIYAAEHYEAFFVQGFNAARDRLWQIDLWRRRGLGRLAEVLGPDYLEQDRAARLFLYRGDTYREWLSYGSDAKRIAEAFVAGVNAYVDLVGSRPELLPPEFELLDSHSDAHPGRPVHQRGGRDPRGGSAAQAVPHDEVHHARRSLVGSPTSCGRSRRGWSAR